MYCLLPSIYEGDNTTSMTIQSSGSRTSEQFHELAVTRCVNDNSDVAWAGLIRWLSPSDSALSLLVS